MYTSFIGNERGTIGIGRDISIWFQRTSKTENTYSFFKLIISNSNEDLDTVVMKQNLFKNILK